MEQGDFLYATCIGYAGNLSNPIINTFEWIVEVMDGDGTLQVDGGYIQSAIIARYYEPLKDIISSQFELEEVILRSPNRPSEGWDGSNASWNGVLAGPMLPPFVTYSVKKTRQNYAMRNGRWAVPCPGTGAVSGTGQPSSTVESLFTTVLEGIGETLMVVEGELADYALRDVIVRKPSSSGTVPTVYSQIAQWTLQGFGTQNTRKS